MPALLGAIAVALTYIYRLKISYRFLILIGSFSLLSIIQSLIFGSFAPKHFIIYPFNFWVCYCIVRSFRERTILHLEFVITLFAALSLMIWAADVVTAGAIRSLLSGVTFGTPYNPIVDSYIIAQTFINEQVGATIPRNSGFAWEPGAFSVFCCVALMANLYRTNFRITKNNNAIILLLALLSSQSTTGYSILMLFLAVKFWRQMRGAYRILVTPVIIASIVFVFMSVPFLQNKISELLEQDLHSIVVNSSYEWNAGSPLAAQRFLSFQVDFADFAQNPWTGYGGNDEQMMIRREGLNIVTVSGIGKIMAKFGIIGTLFFFISAALSSSQLNKRFSSKYPELLLFFVLLVSISYSLIESPIFICLWCYWLFTPKSVVANVVPDLGAPNKSSDRSHLVPAVYHR